MINTCETHGVKNCPHCGSVKIVPVEPKPEEGLRVEELAQILYELNDYEERRQPWEHIPAEIKAFYIARYQAPITQILTKVRQHYQFQDKNRLLAPEEIGDNLDLEVEDSYPCSDGGVTTTVSVDKLLQAQDAKTASHYQNYVELDLDQSLPETGIGDVSLCIWAEGIQRKMVNDRWRKIK